MLMLSKDLTQELSTILSEDYGVELDMNEVSQLGSDLTNFFDVLVNIHSQTQEKKESSPTKYLYKNSQ